MNNLCIQVILVIGVLVAGTFVFMPVQKASTVHTAIIAAITSGAVLADDSLTAAKIATNAIGSDEIAAGAITASEAPNLDAAVSTRADGAAYTPARAANLDNLDTTISSRTSQTSVNDLDNKVGTAGASPFDTLFNGLVELGNRLTSARASKLDNLDATVSSRAVPADINAQDRFMTINVPAGATAIPSTAVTLAKTDGYTGYATIVAVVTTLQAGKNFKLEADTDNDGVAETTVVNVSLSTTGTKINFGDIPAGTDKLFISSNASGISPAVFGASVIIQFNSVIP